MECLDLDRTSLYCFHFQIIFFKGWRQIVFFAMKVAFSYP
jgi:hypothetical protein